MITIIDYNMGNVKSVANAFEELGYEVKVTRQYKDLKKANVIVLPGVGAFGDGMKNLKELDFVQPLNAVFVKIVVASSVN